MRAGIRGGINLINFNVLTQYSATLTLGTPRISKPMNFLLGKAMTEPTEQERLRQLEERINAAKERKAPKPHQEEHYSQAQLAWRMVIELVAGLGIGFGMGYGLDVLFGTLPIFMVLFTMLGLAAGVKTMLRSAQEIQSKKMAEEAINDEGA